MTHIAIFASGNGSNCENIIRYFSGSAGISIDLVVCNKADAPVLERARRLGVPSAVVPKRQLQEEPETVLSMLHSHNIDFIVLAGFLLVVPDYLIQAYHRRMINIHPALLPKYGGKGMWGHHVHEAVKAAGESETGFTVHWVSADVDGGEIIDQRRTALLPTDTADDIAGKEHQLEMAYFPEIIAHVVKGL